MIDQARWYLWLLHWWADLVTGTRRHAWGAFDGVRAVIDGPDFRTYITTDSTYSVWGGDRVLRTPTRAEREAGVIGPLVCRRPRRLKRHLETEALATGIDAKRWRVD